MNDVTAPRVLVILGFYAALLMVIRVIKPRIGLRCGWPRGASRAWTSPESPVSAG